MAEHAVDLPLSPELVLVSPDPEERALVAERTSPPLYVVPPQEIAPLLPEVAPQPEAEPVQPVPVQASAPPPEWRLTVGGATVIALAGLLVFGGGLLVGQYALPVSTPRSLASTVSAKTPQATAPNASREQVPATPIPVRSPKLPTSPIRAKAPVKAVRPVPGGGYVLPAGRGRFRLSSDGRTIGDFALDIGCGNLTLPPIDVAASGTFSFAGHPTAAQGTTVRVRGRFVTPTEARGTAQVASAACRQPATSFVARLS